MPVVLSNPDSLQAEDFRVVMQSGAINTPMCVTLRPAGDMDENRTVLLIGEFGNADDDPPVKVLIVDDVLSDAKPPGELSWYSSLGYSSRRRPRDYYGCSGAKRYLVAVGSGNVLLPPPPNRWCG